MLSPQKGALATRVTFSVEWFQPRNIYEKLFLVNWPMFEKITEKIVQEKAEDSST